MSIADEITRLQSAKANIKSAIENKGVSVPSSAKISAYPLLINAIPSGGGAVLGTKNITANGTYEAEDDSLDGYSEVTVAVPNSYSASDEGKVVDSGALVAQTAHADVTPTTSDQTIDTTLNNSLKVKGDADLVAGNIKKDVEIFGVTGSYEGGGGDPDENLEKLLEGSLETVNCDATSLTLPLRNVSFIKHIFLPEALSIVGDGLYSNTGLIDAVFPKVETINSRAFYSCGNLEAVDLGNPSSIPASCFQSSGKLATIVIRKSTVASLANTNAFNGTKFASGGAGGTIYVPSSLIDSYKAASNWSTIHGYGTITWTAIEGSYYETHYADGTVIS